MASAAGPSEGFGEGGSVSSAVSFSGVSTCSKLCAGVRSIDNEDDVSAQLTGSSDCLGTSVAP